MDVQDPAEHVFDLCTGLKASMTFSLDDEDDPVGQPAITETQELVLLARRDRQTIESALEKLPVKFREIILLCDVEEMSYLEIAETLAVPIARSCRGYRGRERMRELLATRVRGVSR
jgi:RNA polymerase sigma-70 factor (ECF subfamily)